MKDITAVVRSAVLTNDDFRKLLNTPRVATAASAPNTTTKLTRFVYVCVCVGAHVHMCVSTYNTNTIILFLAIISWIRSFTMTSGRKRRGRDIACSTM